MASKKQIDVGGVKIGGGAPVAVQSMTKTETADFDATMKQIHAIAEAGGGSRSLRGRTVPPPGARPFRGTRRRRSRRLRSCRRGRRSARSRRRSSRCCCCRRRRRSAWSRATGPGFISYIAGAFSACALVVVSGVAVVCAAAGKAIRAAPARASAKRVFMAWFPFRRKSRLPQRTARRRVWFGIAAAGKNAGCAVSLALAASRAHIFTPARREAARAAGPAHSVGRLGRHRRL